MSLRKYTQKRNFKETPEPEAKKAHSDKQLEFVVQRHKASRLHYDFRLELDGVLKSWAVPKGPSMNPEDKRLAMMVEDHPYSYRTFKGVIPEGNYGAGIVEIWDHGVFMPLDEDYAPSTETAMLKMLKAGHVKFLLKGRKLKGFFALVKMKGAENNAWLLIKHEDEFSVHKAYDSEALTAASSPINKALKAKTNRRRSN